MMNGNSVIWIGKELTRNNIFLINHLSESGTAQPKIIQTMVTSEIAYIIFILALSPIRGHNASASKAEV